MKQIQTYKWGKEGGTAREGLCPAPTIINSESMDRGDFHRFRRDNNETFVKTLKYCLQKLRKEKTSNLGPYPGPVRAAAAFLRN